MMNNLVSLGLLFFVVLVAVGMASAAMTDPATGIAFAPRLQDEREIVGVGVRKKGPIKVGLCIARFMYMCEHGSLLRRADNPNVTGVFLGFLSTTQLVANQNRHEFITKKLPQK
jgi:hypothetical protein